MLIKISCSIVPYGVAMSDSSLTALPMNIMCQYELYQGTFYLNVHQDIRW
jgi:hypothetical protein